MSASICSFVVAGVLTLIGGLVPAVRRGRDRVRRDALAVEGVLK
jgi:hypothetical protein